MAITPAPTPPDRNDDPDTFVTRADAFVAWMATAADEIIDQFAVVISETDYNTVSTSSVAIGSGSKSFTAEIDKLLQIGQWVNVASAANPANFMFGQVTSYNISTGALVVNVTTVGGSGTLADWVISLSPTGAAGADIWNRSQTFRTTGTPAIVDSTDSTAKKIELRDNGVMKGAIGSGASGASLMDSAGTARVAATTSGAVVTGVASADGLAFPATQVPSADANTLDDYEEGTFTPALKFGGNSTGMTYSKQEGTYTKIGRIVYFQINIALTAKGSSTGAATITVLPFTAAASPITGGTCLAVNMITVAVPAYAIAASGTTIALQDFTGSTNPSMTEGDFNNTSEIYISGSYRV